MKHFKLKLSGATAHVGQGLLCPTHYTRPLGAKVHEHMSRSGGQSEVRLPVFKSPRKLGTLLSTHYSRDERTELIKEGMSSIKKDDWSHLTGSSPDTTEDSSCKGVDED
ncbi:uncharacterized protein TNCV_181591 [Trichonephila clavipes]|nr:uncharacterized protein TNCV_181591 [Trichonephila clavipes]